MAAPKNSRRILIGVITSCSTSTSTADNGAGLGAAHQTGWSGVIALLMDVFARLSARQALDFGKGKVSATMAQQRTQERKAG